ncbi:hypothetical protein CCR75_005383 [Bremia lactucae]|uniref:Eukaryotic translation initiation factor 3 subunit A n=1 Tax=Bremia lactucae TaxID=4779 RepID=A0A976IEG1_BRELC|nr:hypothetical protein CCR75_005383 [Bremia lactucae]
MSHFFHKPENALKRARELLAIPNVDAGVLKRTKHSALEILHDALIAKKNRTWQPTHEELMILYLDICLELQMGRVAKDGLHQYRNLCIQQNSTSLETIIKHFVTQAERKLAAAKKESNELNLLAAAKVDLDAAQTPEDVMLSTTTFEGSNDRTDREVVVPWLRFMWETYRTVLDILKSNSKLESLYMVTAMQAFDFCTEYQRKIEFRRVCEIMRNHLSSLQKHTATPTSQSTRQMRSWDGFTLESVERLLEVRYRQLQVATDLELFSEAFRTIDDINNIMNLVEQTPRVDLLVTYYEKLAQIFQVSKNHLFHAYALYKWYSLRVAGLQGLVGTQVLKRLPVLVSEEEHKEMATRVVLAALSIPLLDFEFAPSVFGDAVSSSGASIADNSLSSATRDKNTRMAALLGFTTTPTRGNLLEDIVAAGILPKASTATSELFHRVELQEVDPLQIVKQLDPFLKIIRSDPLAKAYVNEVERLVVRRVLFQLTRVYASVTISHMRSIFLGLDVSYEEIEALIARSRSLSTVAHTSAPNLSSLYRRSATQHGSNNAETFSADAVASAQTRTKIRIDQVEQCIRFTDAVDLEANAAQLSLLGERLAHAIRKVPAGALTSSAARDQQSKELFATCRSRLKMQRSEMLARREIIERKKVELEKLQNEKLQTLEKKRQEFSQRRAEHERERLAQESRRRDAEKKQKIQDEIKLKETRQLLDKLGHTDVSNLDLASIDKDKVVSEAKEKARKAKELAQQKLRENARRLDYIVRATREEEQPVLQQQFAKAKAEAIKRYEVNFKANLKRVKEEHEHSLKEKARFAPAIVVSAEFVKAHRARRIEEYKKVSKEQKNKAMLERLNTRVAHAKERYDEKQRLLREEKEEEERVRREMEAEQNRKLQLQTEEEVRRQEKLETEERRNAEEKEQEEKMVRECEEAKTRVEQRSQGQEEKMARECEEAKTRVEQRSQGQWGSAGLRGLSNHRRSEETDDREWTRVNRSGLSSRLPTVASESLRDRRGPPTRDIYGDRDRRDRAIGAVSDGRDRAIGSDRDGAFPRSDREEIGQRLGFNSDRDGSALRRGLNEGRDGGSGFRRPFNGDRAGSVLRRGIGEESGSGGWIGRDSLRRGSDRDGGRDTYRRNSDRDDRGHPRREDGDRDSIRRTGERDGDDRFFNRSQREGSYRAPHAGNREGSFRAPHAGNREGPRETNRNTTGAPESGNWR